ncbi:uncharacterized protein EI97DRAFT_465123 [Westerdykella ornata]|uniref:Uncharacterized protein n=1 Tax=Westerdykella ornata TaxID=318751 RepID=A0A6A6JR31_WESOR|nr:uncharacterized protein EI97DRAFT_465123 [Westerdykella ornata]KAF2278704.1 hypothetical protein EI97DRAFT_465123 [Westerdykella ornata]
MLLPHSLRLPSLLAVTIRLSHAAAPPSLKILNNRVLDCAHNITTTLTSPSSSSLFPSSNTTLINIIIDTTTSHPNNSGDANDRDALAYTDSTPEGEWYSACTVCVEVGLAEGGKGRRRGVLTGLEYDYDHYLERGLLEGVVSHARRERDGGEQWFETSYYYGPTPSPPPDAPPRDPELPEPPAAREYLLAYIPGASEPLVFDLESQNNSGDGKGTGGRTSDEVCLETNFAVYNRIGVKGSKGEIARRSVFRVGVGVEWE